MLASLRRIALAVAIVVPLAPRAEVVLLDEDLRPPDVRILALLQQGTGTPPPAEKQPAGDASKDASSSEDALDFDLLGEAKPPPVPPEDRSMKRRRQMLGIHQAAGIGLFSLQVATTVVGQLNYSDKFGDANTGRYKTAHQALAYTTLAVFAANGALALLAPDAPAKPDRGFDRVSLHKVSMFTAAAGMAAQVALGIYTARREGYENKQDFGRAHLVVGYATLAAMVVGVSALVF